MLLNKAVAVTFLIIAHFDDFCKGRYNILMFRRLKQWSESHKTLIAIIVALLFAVSQIPLLLNHEIWNDEATSWQLSPFFLSMSGNQVRAWTALHLKLAQR